MKIETTRVMLANLRVQFDELETLTQGLETPNGDDSHEIKCAIVAFSLHTRTENWCREHFMFVRDRLDAAKIWDSKRANILRAMCLGWLCGAAYEKKLTEVEFQLADAQLPGLMTLEE